MYVKLCHPGVILMNMMANVGCNGVMAMPCDMFDQCNVCMHK